MLTLNLIEWLNSLCKLPRRFSHIDESRNLAKGIFIVSGDLFVVGKTRPLPIFECKISNDKIKCEKYISSLSNGILGVSASLLAASLTDILVGMRDVWIREEKQGSFRKFFGIDNDGNNKIAVVLPQFSIQSELKKDNKLQELEKSLQITLSYRERMMIKANEGFYSSSDLQSSTSLNILFDRVKILSSNTKNNTQEIVKPRLEYTTERKDLKKNKLADFNEYNVLFVIGLFSNALLMGDINPHHQNKVFKIGYSEEKTSIKIANNKQSIANNKQSIANNKQSDEFWEEVSDEESYFYGLLARLNVGGKMVFVYGGIKAELTIKCSEFLLENWEDIYQKLSGEIGFSLPTDWNFAICMGIEKIEDTKLDMTNICSIFIENPNGRGKFVK